MRLLATLTLLTLIIVGVAGIWLLPSTDATEQSLLIARLIMSFAIYFPLALFLPATLKSDKRLLTWLCFILMFYFCGYVTQLLDPPPIRTLAAAKVALTSVLFVFAMLAIRGPRQTHD